MRMFHRDPNAGCSFDGKEYVAQDDGSFEVPDAAAPELASHGFSTSKPERESEGDAADLDEGSVAALEEMLNAAHLAGLDLAEQLAAAVLERDALAERVKALETQGAERG